MSDGGKQDKRSDDGNFQITAASIDQTSASKTETESSSTPTLLSTMDGYQRPIQDDDPQRSISPLEWKKKGNVYFGKEDWEQALHAYLCGLSVLQEQRATLAADPLEVALRSNMAFVLLKLQRYDQAEEECNQLLKISPANSKGTIRPIKIEVVSLMLSIFLKNCISDVAKSYPSTGVCTRGPLLFTRQQKTGLHRCHR